MARPSNTLSLGFPRPLGYGLRGVGIHCQIRLPRHLVGFECSAHPRSHGQDAHLPGLHFRALRPSTVNTSEGNSTLISAQPLWRCQAVSLFYHAVSVPRAAGSYQRLVCDRQNRWYQALPSAGQTRWLRCNQPVDEAFCAAVVHQPLLPWRQYHPTPSHGMAALIRRFHEAKMAGSPTVTRSGTGSPLCECLHGDNLDEVCVMR
jgi:hypothetical protein